MKPLKYIIIFTLIMLMSLPSLAQRRGQGRHPHRHGKVVVVKRSPYRPKTVVVYHPVWGPKYAYNRRWVYFPKYNLYWDNWRNHYFFRNGTIWISQPSPPPVVVNVNLVNEKQYELKEEEDDNDEINSSNPDHQLQYKGD